MHLPGTIGPSVATVGTVPADQRRDRTVVVKGGVGRRGFLRAAVALPLAAAAGCTSDRTAAPAPPPTSLPTQVPAGTAATAPPTPPVGELAHARSGRPEAALTFHGAGDLDLARRVLTLLHDRGAAVTVLAVGTWLQQYPDAPVVQQGQHPACEVEVAGAADSAGW